jgi:hypothetical protein
MKAGTIVVDRRMFNRGLDVMMKEYGTSAAGVMRRQMSILSGQLAKRYPPKTKGHGKGAIAQDLLGGRKVAKGNTSKGIFNTDKNEIAQYEAAEYAGLANLVPTAHVIKTKTGAIYGVDNKLYKPNASMGEMRAHHEKFRSKRTGRVTTAGSYDRTIGRWKFVDKMYVKHSRMNSYIRQRAKEVGKLKGGWAGGTVKWKGGKKPAKWIMNHAKTGNCIDRMKENGNGYLEIRNEVAGQNRPGWKGINRFVVNSRERGFQKELKAAVRKADKAGNRVR